MEKGNDRISQLPDAVLHYILSLMPMKFMVRTSILSRRGSNLWKDVWAYSTVLDFGAEFATGQTQEEFESTVNRYLQLHKAKEIEMFRLSLIPCNLSYAEKWVKFSGARGVRKVDIHFRRNTYDDVCYSGYMDWFRRTLPRKLLNSTFSRLLNSIFSCDSITQLNLSSCYLHLRLNFKGYPYLKMLQLSTVRITNALFESMLPNCPLLEELILRNGQGLTCVKVSAPNLPLKRLTVIDCWSATEIEIFAPNLQSFHFYSNFISMYFKNILSLVDVLLNCMFIDGYVHVDDWMTTLHHLGHVKILTLCYGTLELDEHPSVYYGYERLPGEDPLDIVFDHLKVIKMTRFTGIGLQMQLVKFFLEKAIVLESLVLVAPQNSVCKTKKYFALESQFVDEPLRILRERLLILAKTSSSNARIVICEYSDDDGTLVPTQADFGRRWCVSPNTC